MIQCCKLINVLNITLHHFDFKNNDYVFDFPLPSQRCSHLAKVRAKAYYYRVHRSYYLHVVPLSSNNSANSLNITDNITDNIRPIQH